MIQWIIARANRWAPLFCVAVALLHLAGCRPQEQIRSYTVPSEDAPAAFAKQPASPPRPSEPTHRMIGAIVPTGDRAWFFKVVGPLADVDPLVGDINGFFAGLRIESSQPAWDLPEGWSAKEASGMRLATLLVPVPDSEPKRELELSVIGLPLVGEWGAQVVDNANRWRNQLGLGPLATGQQLAPIDGVEGAVLFDEQGVFEAGSMAPFAGGMNGPSPGAPPVSAPPRTDASEIAFESPEGWTAKPLGSMRKASFDTASGAEVTGFVFSAAASMADPLANVNRWRGEIGLGPTTPEELSEAEQSVSLTGVEAKYYVLKGESETTLAAMAVRDNQVWFFKLRGPSDAAEADQAAFRNWLTTIKLP